MVNENLIELIYKIILTGNNNLKLRKGGVAIANYYLHGV